MQVSRGPAVTRFELQPPPGVKISRITNLSNDIALSLAAQGVRIEAPIPGKAAIGIEIPNENVAVVKLRDIIESSVFAKAKSSLSFCLGKDITGKNVVTDLSRMPHMLIAGATGSGKSVCINSIIISFIYKSSPENLRMILIDPKRVELSIYNGIPHLLIPVVNDAKKAAGALNWAINEMSKRYQLFSDNMARDISRYNEIAEGKGLEKLPQIVIIIDELADLMAIARNEVEDSIVRLAQLARAAGIHLIIATQRPSVDVITGIIKANIPTRIAFSVYSQIDARTILDTTGAEKLLGRGDMLFNPSGAPKPIRLQGAFVTEKEVHDVTQFIKNDKANYSDEIIEDVNKMEKAAGKKGKNGATEMDEPGLDNLVNDGIDVIFDMEQASISLLQRKLRVGYARAARIVDDIERVGVIGPKNGSKPREILTTRQIAHEKVEQFEG
jgi:S-DNA-T family DNA segregation ATPase FtsK/SpoIIIE